MNIIAQVQTDNHSPPPPQPESRNYTYELVGVSILLLILYLMRHKVGRLGNARFANKWDRLNAHRKAEKQIREKKTNKVTLFCGTPRSKGLLGSFASFFGTPPTRYINDAQRGTLVVGSPESGKSFSLINPAIRSAIQQGLPVIVYDSQEVQIQDHAAYAASMGYQVHAFAPGKPYSGTLNVLDFLAGPDDKLRSQQLAHVLNANGSSDPSAKKDKFFSSAADSVVQLALMAAKMSSLPDIVQAYQFLSLPNLTARLRYAEKTDSANPWLMLAASTLKMAADAPETVSGIMSTASVTLRNLIDKEFMSCLSGQTTIPMRLEGKQILFLVLDAKTGEVMSPLLAAALHLLILENFSYDRKDPLVVSLDELPTIYLPQLVEWINTLRKKGFCPLLGIQNLSQLEARYGQAGAQSIVGACGTKAFFNPSHGPSAEAASKYFGERDKVLRTRNYSSGRSPSSTSNEQVHKIPLISPDRLLTLKTGHCAFTNPGYGSGETTGHAMLGPLVIPRKDCKQASRSERLWPKVRQRMADAIARTRPKEDDITHQLQYRALLATSLLPEEYPEAVVNEALAQQVAN